MKLYEIQLARADGVGVLRYVVDATADRAVNAMLRSLPAGEHWSRAHIVSVKALLENADVLVGGRGARVVKLPVLVVGKAGGAMVRPA